MRARLTDLLFYERNPTVSRQFNDSRRHWDFRKSENLP